MRERTTQKCACFDLILFILFVVCVPIFWWITANILALGFAVATVMTLWAIFTIGLWYAIHSSQTFEGKQKSYLYCGGLLIIVGIVASYAVQEFVSNDKIYYRQEINIKNDVNEKIKLENEIEKKQNMAKLYSDICLLMSSAIGANAVFAGLSARNRKVCRCIRRIGGGMCWCDCKSRSKASFGNCKAFRRRW